MTAEDDELGSPSRFDIYLLISHPSLPSAAITRGMRWRPYNAHPSFTASSTPAATSI